MEQITAQNTEHKHNQNTEYQIRKIQIEKYRIHVGREAANAGYRGGSQQRRTRTMNPPTRPLGPGPGLKTFWHIAHTEKYKSQEI